MTKVELTNEQIAEAHKVMDKMMRYFWSRIINKMLIENMTFDMAVEQVKLDLLNE